MMHWNEGKDSLTMIQDLQLFYKNRLNRKIKGKWPAMERVIKTLQLPEEHRRRAEEAARAKKHTRKPGLVRNMTMKFESTLRSMGSVRPSYETPDRMLRVAVGASTLSAERLTDHLAFAAKQNGVAIKMLRDDPVEDEGQPWEGKKLEVLRCISAHFLKVHKARPSQAAETQNVDPEHQEPWAAHMKRIALDSLRINMQKLGLKQQTKIKKLSRLAEKVLGRRMTVPHCIPV
eukprot:gene26026-31864_t